MNRRSSITREELIYGYDNSIRLHESGLFFVKGKDGNKVVLNKFPQNVKTVEILDEHADSLPILSKVFTFKPTTENKVLIETLDGDFIYFEYKPEKGGFVEKKYF